MSLIKINNLTFSYQNNYDYIFKDVSFQIDTDWKLGFERIQFEKNLENYSAGQKKKVLIAKSLCEKAHIYVWDEPLNYIDLYSRLQIEKLIKQYNPTMILVEHDQAFANAVATKFVKIDN